MVDPVMLEVPDVQSPVTEAQLEIATEAKTKSSLCLIGESIECVARLVGNSPLSISNHQKGEFWIAGCSSQFLSRIAGQVDPFVL